jgi:cytidylate kinase
MSRVAIFANSIITFGAQWISIRAERKRAEGRSMFITISRQFAAGGSKVAKAVADSLDWTVVDDAFIHEIAQRTGYSPEEIADMEERVPSFMERFARSSAAAFPENLVASPSWIDQPDALRLARVTRDVVEELGHRDRVVLVGRAAAAVLAREKSAIHARLVAPVDYRVRQAIDRLGLPEKKALSHLEEIDDNRARYHRELYDRDWNDPVHYHFVLNTGLLGSQGAARIIVGHARELGW